MVINARTRKRQLIWAEIDSNPADPEDVTLIIRPGRNFDEGERYIVALRDLKRADGTTIAPREEFRAYRDALTTTDPDIEAPRAHHEELFQTLAKAGIARRDLYLTWDFTVASRQSLTDRALSIRDDAFAAAGRHEPGRPPDPGRRAHVRPEPDLPDGLSEPAARHADRELRRPGRLPRVQRGRERHHRAPDHRHDHRALLPGPTRLSARDRRSPWAPTAGRTRIPGNTTTANVICTVPRKAVDQGAASPPARISLYGHGLLGSAGEVGGSSAQPFANDQNIVFCATDWIGMSTFDVPNVLTLLQDLSNFRSLVDRSQQGFLNFMYLGRWLSHPQGAAALDALQGGWPVGDRSRPSGWCTTATARAASWPAG